MLLLLAGCSTTPEERRQEELRREVIREIQYGRLLSKKILTRYPLYRNENATLYVNKVGKSVALFAGRPELEYHFAILDTDAVNAFAAPGGYIYITKGALKQMDNEAQLAAVLAHEIGHVNNKHIMKQLPPPRETGATALFSTLLVSQGTLVSSALNETVSSASDLLFKKGYMIQDEYEADRSAVNYLDATGYNQAALVSFLQTIDTYKRSHSAIEVYHTHPPNADRIRHIQQYMNKQNISTQNRALVTWRFQQNMKSIQ